MKTRHTHTATLGIALACLFVGPGAGAQAIDTRMGTLQLENGYPSRAALKTLYDEMDFQRATQAYLWGLPAVGFHGMHLAHLEAFGARDGEIVLYQTVKDKAGMLTPNLTTLYAMSFWNLAVQGPLVVDVPAGATAGGVLDVWQRPVTDMGQTGPDKGKGGKYLILPPGAKAVQAPGYIVMRSPTNQVWFATRGLEADRAKAEATVRKHRLYAWADRAGPGTTRYVPVDGRPWKSEQPNDLTYWKQLRDVLEPEPPEARDGYFLAMLRSIGIEKGKPFRPDDRAGKLLTEAAVAGDLMARATAYDKRFPDTRVWPGAHWEYSNMVALDQQARTFAQFDERVSWFYEAIGNSVGMQGKTVGFGQVYLETAKDQAGAWLDGGKRYRLRVPPDAPVKQFWSFTLYDNLTRGPLISPQGAADISSRKEGLEKNADGSVDLYFGPDKPAGSNANFVQTMPGRGWFTYFRLYGPTEAYFDKRWALPDIAEIK